MIWPATRIHALIKTASIEVCERRLRSGDALRANAIVGLPFGAFTKIYLLALLRSWLWLTFCALIGLLRTGGEGEGFLLGLIFGFMLWLVIGFFCMAVPGSVAKACRAAHMSVSPPPLKEEKAVAPIPAPTGIEARLREIDRLHGGGHISPEERADLRAKLLSHLHEKG